MHVLQTQHSQLLLDCGLHQGRKADARIRNEQFPFDPASLDAMILSHAHVDHCGNMPTLVKQGFSGPIFCTPATRDLLRVMLRDSAKIQEEEAAHFNIANDYPDPLIEPLYTFADVEKMLKQVVGVPFDKEVVVSNDIRFKLNEAGHILGSACANIAARGVNREYTLCFSGDLGRRGMPLLHPASPVPACDLLVCESTYGNRVHEPLQETIDLLLETVRVTVARGGKVLIPAFSLGRCQVIIHLLQVALRSGEIPNVPIHVDSPLAAAVAEVYRQHPNVLEPSVAQSVREGHGILGGDGVTYIRSNEESLHLTTMPGSRIIIASSGMCDAGRIVSHIQQNVDDPRCSLILVSFQAPGTTGRRLLENSPTIRIQGRDLNKWIDVVHLKGFSGHADRDDFIDYLSPVADRIGKVRLIHGERDQAEALALTLRGIGFADVAVPFPSDSVSLAAED